MNDVLYTITRHLVLAHLFDKPCFLGFLAVQGGYRIIGEGREIKLEGKCSRSKLLSQCIKYLGPKEREDYEIVIEDGKSCTRRVGKSLTRHADHGMQSGSLFSAHLRACTLVRRKMAHFNILASLLEGQPLLLGDWLLKMEL